MDDPLITYTRNKFSSGRNTDVWEAESRCRYIEVALTAILHSPDLTYGDDILRIRNHIICLTQQIIELKNKGNR